jgi:segregation and condensation protein A
MSYDIHLPTFEGPFDLLIHLIRQNQVDIYDIPISLITDQYMAYLDQMKEMDLEIASSFLVMAATLLAIKSKMLLPTPPSDEEEIEDARAELVHDIIEYMHYKDAAISMGDMVAKQRLHYSRPNEDELYLNMFSEENPLDGKTLADLRSAFAQVMKKAHESGLIMHIEREQITVADRLEYLYHQMLSNPDGVSFYSIFDQCSSKMALIVTFLALLELVRRTIIKIAQTNTYSEIYLYPGDLTKYEPND